MTRIINLRQARKRRARDEGRARGDANAARHGRPKAEREATEAQAALDARRLDGHRKDGPEDRGGEEARQGRAPCGETAGDDDPTEPRDG